MCVLSIICVACVRTRMGQSPYSFETVSLTEPVQGRCPQASAVLLFVTCTAQGCKLCGAILGVYFGVRDLNSDPHAYAASTVNHQAGAPDSQCALFVFVYLHLFIEYMYVGVHVSFTH